MYEKVKTKSPTICNKPHCYRFRILLKGENAAQTSNFVMKLRYGTKGIHNGET